MRTSWITLWLSLVVACGSNDDASELTTSTGGAASDGEAGTNGSGASGGNPWVPSGGSAGSAGSGGSGASGGAAGESGSAGTSTGGSGGSPSEGCPSTEPTLDAPCSTAGQVCCYAAAPAKPWRCVPSNPDGGALIWKSLLSRVCCPETAPQLAEQCNTPSDLKCCYPGAGFFCNGQPEPDVWATTTCN